MAANPTVPIARTNASKALLKSLGGDDACRKAAKESENDNDEAKVDSVDVNGDKATAHVTVKSGKQTISFVKEDGDWKVSG